MLHGCNDLGRQSKRTTPLTIPVSSVNPVRQYSRTFCLAMPAPQLTDRRPDHCQERDDSVHSQPFCNRFQGAQRYPGERPRARRFNGWRRWRAARKGGPRLEYR
ncbi:hypothetical protein ppKF707_5757 [Metapseudomonas furukawaii]|nr:hypothetical protein ppKF707_5757 [Pseudomonas furukawaii]